MILLYVLHFYYRVRHRLGEKMQGALIQYGHRERTATGHKPKNCDLIQNSVR